MQTLYNIPGVGRVPAGTPFTFTLQFTDEETGEPYLDPVKFPGNWLENATADELEWLGITVVPPPPPEPEPEDDPPSEEPPA